MARPRSHDPDYKRSPDGSYCYRVPINGSRRHRWVSTGEATLERARLVVEEAGADRLVMLANARAMTHDALSCVLQGKRVSTTDVVRGWHAWMVRRVSAGSLEDYLAIVVQFVERNGIATKPLTSVGENELEEFVNADGRKWNTRTQRHCALSWFYRYAQAHGYIIGNPMMLVEINRREMSVEQLEPKHREPITETEYWTILGSKYFKQDWRDVIVLSYCCGLRLIDCALLEWSSFTSTEIVVYVKKHYSGGKRLALSLDDPLIMRPELRQAIDRLLATPEPRGQYVWPEFAARFNGPSDRYMSNRFADVCHWLGIKKSFHGLRVALARRLREQGKTLEQVAKVLAHSSVETTKIYSGESAVNTPAPADASP